MFSAFCPVVHVEVEKGTATHSSILLPGESQGQRILAGYSLWGCKELEQLTKQQQRVEANSSRSDHIGSI